MNNVERVATGIAAAAVATASTIPPSVLKIPESVASAVRASMAAARDHLLGLQQGEGFWVGELEADTTLESDYILLEYYLGTARQEKIRKAANYILSKQL